MRQNTVRTRANTKKRQHSSSSLKSLSQIQHEIVLVHELSRAPGLIVYSIAGSRALSPFKLNFSAVTAEK